ncbi:cell cycle checkpoint control protein RAD9A [Achroia grisella]|uniref:cell cycle checkpoint control protein RAD9A n=1 Tax=Achroia grisella TaxID=688607 RepID=UPI0027D2FE2D|nr:cell cycle checkpoint control protein RAD9A [Achroia grisella]
MKCYVPGSNVKVLGRTVHALARFGDELYLESLPDCMLLRTLNAAESAYAMVKFNKNFFSYFNFNYFSNEDNEGLKCKISMKSALNTFKSPTHMDKQVENLEIKLDPEACKLIFQLKCKHGIVKTHYVSILDCKAMQAVYTKDSVPNRITSSQRLLSETLSNFQSSDDQVTLEATTQSLILRNYTECSGDSLKIIRTQINLKPIEFTSYSIGTATTITFTLKEFRALLSLAEALSLPIQLHFETTGRPVVFIVHNGSTFEAHFVLATSKPDGATQATSTQNTTIERKRKETSYDSSARKKVHIDTDISKCLDEDSHLFNFIDIPDEIPVVNSLSNGKSFIENNINRSNCKSLQMENNDNGKENDDMDHDHIPASPTSKAMIKSVFKRCFESTFDPRAIRGVVLAEDSDSE